jgi:hypothetical protein
MHKLRVEVNEQQNKLNIESTQHCVNLEVGGEREELRRYYS